MAASSSRGRSSGRSGRGSSGAGTRGRTGARSSRAKSSGGASRSGKGRRKAASSRSRGADEEREQGASARRGRARAGAAQGRRAGAAKSSRSPARGRAQSGRSRSQGATRSRASSRAQAGRSSSARGASGRARGQSTRAGSSRGAARTSQTSRTPRSSRRALDPLAMLREDHRRVAKLFQQFEKTKDARRKKQLFDSIRGELELHARLEEELFYPDADRREELKEHVEEAHGEHNKVKQMLREGEGMDPDSGEFDAHVAGLKGAVEHHVEEEENEMFPKVKQGFSQEHLQELGRRMQERRAALQRGNGATGEGRSLVGRLMGR